MRDCASPPYAHRSGVSKVHPGGKPLQKESPEYPYFPVGATSFLRVDAQPLGVACLAWAPRLAAAFKAPVHMRPFQEGGLEAAWPQPLPREQPHGDRRASWEIPA